MDKYELLNQIGDGTFGSVTKAVSKKTGQLVAIKRMKQKYYTWDECVRLPEVEVVRRIHGHPNIVKLREVIRENNELFFVFEFMDGDLLGVIRKAKQAQRPEDALTAPAIPYPVVKNYMRQLLQALAYLHRRGYFHRDLKPENLLIKREVGDEEVIKLGDFGLVKDVRGRPPFTDYVSTRWYRAPELLLQDRAYGTPVDIWAAGCLMAELITTKPLFPGANEVDQLFKIMNVLGSPDERSWPAGMTLARKIRYAFPSVQGMGLAKALPRHMPAQALNLLEQMLTYDPKARITAEQCLQHPFLNVGIDESNGAMGATQEQISDAARRLHASPQSAPAALPTADAPRAKLPGSTEPTTNVAADHAAPTASPVLGLAHGSVSPQKFYMLHQRRSSEMNALPKATLLPAQNGVKGRASLEHAPPRRDSDLQSSLPPQGTDPLLPSGAEATQEQKVSGKKAVLGAAKEDDDVAGPRYRALAAGVRNLSTRVVVPRKVSGLVMGHGVSDVGDSAPAQKNPTAAHAGPTRNLSLAPQGGGADLTSPAKYGLTNVHLSPYRQLAPVAKAVRGSVGKGGGTTTQMASPSGLNIGTEQSSSGAGALAKAGTTSERDNAALRTKGEVDLDHLVEEFASELSTLGMNVQRQGRPSKPDTTAGLDGVVGNGYTSPKGSLTGVNPIAALLHNTRYKPSVFQSEKRNDSLDVVAGSPYASRATKVTPEVSTKNVSPALRALLAKHRVSNSLCR